MKTGKTNRRSTYTQLSPGSGAAFASRPFWSDHGNVNQKDSKNNSAIPEPLKVSVEGLSGFSMDDVKVHYDSPKPARFGAKAMTEGGNIYVGPQQEKHLPHEAWHIVQQKQGRVKPTTQVGQEPINVDPALEVEAEETGKRLISNSVNNPSAPNSISLRTPTPNSGDVAQFWPGEEKLRKLKAKVAKKKYDAASFAHGIAKGGGLRSRYHELNAPTEMHFENDILDEESAGRQRLEDYPVAERTRKFVAPVAKHVLKEGAEAVGTAVGSPLAGKGAKKVAGKLVEKANERAIEKMTSGKAYKVLRDESDEYE